MSTNKRKRDSSDSNPTKKTKSNAIVQYPSQRSIGHGWSLEIRQLEKADADCVPDLFDSIQDYKDFVFFESNAIVGLVKDEYGVWRGGFVGYYYEKPTIIKIPLFATSLHFRRQGLGRLLLAYLHEQSDSRASIIPLAMDDDVALSFWQSMGCEKVRDCSEINTVLTKDEIENLIAMKLSTFDSKLEDLINKFASKPKPVYKDMMKRYASTEEEIKLLKECQKQMELGNMKALVDVADDELENEQEGEDEDEDFDIDAEEDEDEEEYVFEGDLDALDDHDDVEVEDDE